MQPAGDHQVNHQPQTVVEFQRDALAGAVHANDGVPEEGGQRRLHRTQKERTPDDGRPQAVPDDAGSQRLYINFDVGEFGHRAFGPWSSYYPARGPAKRKAGQAGYPLGPAGQQAPVAGVPSGSRAGYHPDTILSRRARRAKDSSPRRRAVGSRRAAFASPGTGRKKESRTGSSAPFRG